MPKYVIIFGMGKIKTLIAVLFGTGDARLDVLGEWAGRERKRFSLRTR